MRTARILRIAVSLGVLSALATGPTTAQAAEPCTDELGNLVFTEVTQWVKAPSQRIGNLGATDLGDYPTWNGTAPTQSVQSGAGGASYENRLPFNPLGSEYDPKGSGHFVGKFNGCIDKIAWDLYLLSPVPPLGGNVVSDLKLVIDGTVVWLTPGDPGPDINAPAEGSSGLLYRLQFVFTGIHAAMKSSPGDFQPLDGEHSIELTMFNQFINDGQGFYVYDTTEVPSRLTFNKAAGLSAYTKLDPAG